jgi:hypothetical protein
MPLTEKEIDYLESKIPELAYQAGKQAYLKALMSGHSVMHTKGDKLIETFPDGTEKFIKHVKPGIKMKVGQKIKLK